MGRPVASGAYIRAGHPALIHVGNKDHGDMIMRATGGRFSPVTMEVISRSENGILRGGVVYENYTGKGGSILVHIAGFDKKWINRDMFWIMFDYPFKQLDCKQAFAQVRATNTEALDFCKNIGWEEIFTLEGVFPNDDMLLLRMKRADCRFLKLKPHRLTSKKEAMHGQA